VLLTGLSSAFIISHIVGSGPLVETAKRVARRGVRRHRGRNFRLRADAYLDLTPQSQTLVDLARAAGVAVYNTSAICFSIGSLLFFYLFYTSRYIPRTLSAIGIWLSPRLEPACGSCCFAINASRIGPDTRGVSGG
jgi:hypothetical protein